MSQSTINAPAVAPRRTLWVVGAVLWSVVFVALGAIIWNRRQRDDAPPASNSTLSVQQVDKVVDPAAAPSTAVVVDIPTSGDGGGQVIDLTELMGQTKPTNVPLWDPAGIEDFSFQNCDGRTITKQDLLGQPWAVCFVFTKCLGPCPTVTRQFRTLQDRLKDVDVRLVTLTVDPVRDTPEVLLNYAKMNGADLDKWYFLSADQNVVYPYIHRNFRVPVQEAQGPKQEGFEIIHSTFVMLVDANGVVQGKYNAAKDEEMATLRRELQRLAKTDVDGG
jgi:cytochrome oxidase Cu insertion factor (SCO1/SenC/PrrC family)